MTEVESNHILRIVHQYFALREKNPNSGVSTTPCHSAEKTRHCASLRAPQFNGQLIRFYLRDGLRLLKRVTGARNEGLLGFEYQHYCGAVCSLVLLDSSQPSSRRVCCKTTSLGMNSNGIPPKRSSHDAAKLICEETILLNTIYKGLRRIIEIRTSSRFSSKTDSESRNPNVVPC